MTGQTTQNDQQPATTPTNQQQVPPGLPQPGTVPTPPTAHTAPTPAVPGDGLHSPAKTAPAAQTATPGSIADFAGDLVNDPYAKVGLSYIEAAIAGTEADLRRAFGKAAEYGDVNLIDEAYLRDVLGDKADAVVQQAKALFEYSTHKAQQTLQEVYSAVGGEHVLQQAVPYFNQAATPEQRKAIALLLDSGDPATMKYAAQQVVDFARQGGMVQRAGQQPLGQAGAVQGISQEEYVKAIMERNLSAEKYEQLKQARMLGKQQGL